RTKDMTNTPPNRVAGETSVIISISARTPAVLGSMFIPASLRRSHPLDYFTASKTLPFRQPVLRRLHVTSQSAISLPPVTRSLPATRQAAHVGSAFRRAP